GLKLDSDKYVRLAGSHVTAPWLDIARCTAPVSALAFPAVTEAQNLVDRYNTAGSGDSVIVVEKLEVGNAHFGDCSRTVDLDQHASAPAALRRLTYQPVHA